MSKRTKAKQIVLGLPADGIFGTTNVPGVDSTDNPTEALDKVIKILDLLAPSQSPNLSSRTLSISNIYTGRECSLSISPGANYTKIIDNTSPTAIINAEFADGDQGTLETKINTVLEGSVVLTSIDDSGTYGALTIITDSDPYPGPPEAGFWKSITASMTTASLLPTDNIEQLYEMEHSITGVSSLSFKVDTVPTTPTITLSGDPLNVKAGYNTKYISGVPSISSGDVLECEYTIIGAVSRFYHSTRIATVTGSQISNINVVNPLTIPTANGSMNVFEEVNVSNNIFTTNLGLIYKAYNVKNTGSINYSVTRQDSVVGQNIYVDTISNESIRVRSGQSTYPSFSLTGATNYGQPYTPVISQMVIGTNDVVEEIQLIGGIFKYPTGNYTNNYPVPGPNYIGVAGVKWVTFNIGNITNASSITFSILNAIGINEEAIGSTVTLNMECYLIVEGSTGWLDANEKYINGDPSINGDPCYDVGGSPNNGTTRRCTFGTQTLTGSVYIRIGLPSGSTKNFTDVVKV